MTDATTLTIESVDYLDPRAAALREQMDVEMNARYARPGESIPDEIVRALHLDPVDVRATVLITDDTGEPIAQAVLRVRGEDWEVKRVIVVESVRGRGIGGILMAELEERARRAGVRRLILQTGDKQPEAVRLYTRIGYLPIPIYEPYVSALPFSLCFGKVLEPTGH